MQRPTAKIPVESGFEGGHGSHWDAVLEDPGELGRVVAEVYKRGSIEHQQTIALEVEGFVEVKVRALPLGTPSFAVRLIEVTPPGADKPRIATIYPHMRDAKAVGSARAQRLLEWGSGAFEATVRAELVGGRGEVHYFATDHFTKRADYRSGEPFALALSAVAYTCGTISHKERLEAFAGGEVDVSKSTIIAPLKDSERAPYYDDDYFLQGPLVSCVPFAYPPWGEGALLKLDLGDLGTLPVAARKKDFPFGWPKRGEYVAAYAWMQGRMADAP